MDFPQHTGVGQVDSMSDKISFHLYILRCRTSHKYAHVDGPITHHKQRFLNHYTPQMGEREKKKQTMHMETQPPTCTDCWTNHPLWMNVEMHLVLNLAAGDHRVGRPASCYINSEKKKTYIFSIYKKTLYFSVFTNKLPGYEYYRKAIQTNFQQNYKIMLHNKEWWETANDNFKTPSLANALAYTLASCRLMCIYFKDYMSNEVSKNI